MASVRAWAAVVVVLALGACSGSPKKPDPLRASAGFGDAPAVSPTDVEQAEFRSPSGNIGCRLDKDGARCDIVKKSWTPPPKPTDCELDWGFGISVHRAEPARFTCAGDTVLGAKKTLKYGEAVRAGDLTCSSDRSGMRCENTASGHGFTLSVKQYHIF
jgi:hypothetical protein